MPGPILHLGAIGVCAHGGAVALLPANPRVLVNGAPVMTMADPSVVAGCSLPVPCVTVQWAVPAMRVLAGGVPVLLQTSLGLGIGAAPQGPVTMTTCQPRVIGS